MFIEYFSNGSEDCSLILLYGREPEVVARLHEMIVALADEKTEHVAVHEINGFESIAGCQLFFSVSSRDIGINAGGEPKSFECQLRTNTWDNMAGLLEHFANTRFSEGFQYLDSHGAIRLMISDRREW